MRAPAGVDPGPSMGRPRCLTIAAAPRGAFGIVADGPVSYWNAYVAITQMHGHGTFVDPRMA